MELMEINPFIRYARLHGSVGYSDLCRCYDCRLFVFCDGSGSIEANGEKYNFSKGNAVFLPFGTIYRFLPSRSDVVFYALDFDLTNEYSELSGSLRTPLLGDFQEGKMLKTDAPLQLDHIFSRVVNLSEIREALSEICKLYLRKSPCFMELASGLLKYVLCAIASKDGRNADDLCEKVLEFIYENYADTELSNTVIAAKFGYHPYYLANLVKRQTGKTLHQHLSDFRLSASQDLLLGSGLDIATISWKCGFSSTSHFIKRFREKEGITPLAYRNRNFI